MTASHRSRAIFQVAKRTPGESRIDVLFKPAHYIEVLHRVPSLVVHETRPEDWPAGHAVLRPEVVGPSDTIYKLAWRGGTGCIVAGAFAWHEDDGDYSTPSYFEGRAWLERSGP